MVELTEKFIIDNSENETLIIEAKKNIEVYNHLINYWEKEYGIGWIDN